jgi:hypothetical protein
MIGVIGMAYSDDGNVGDIVVGCHDKEEWKLDEIRKELS